ncbi:hypothetical protein ES708_33378 [subsurface metagenome]
MPCRVFADVADDKGKVSQHQIIVMRFGVEEDGIPHNLSTCCDLVLQSLHHATAGFPHGTMLSLQKQGCKGGVLEVLFGESFDSLQFVHSQIDHHLFDLDICQGGRFDECRQPAGLQCLGGSPGQIKTGVRQNP